MDYVLIIIFSTLLGWLIYWHNEHKRKFSPLNNIPGPKPLPILGNVLEFGLNPVEKLRNLHRISNTYGSLVKFWIGFKNIYLIVTDPEFCELILSSPKYIKKSADYDIFKPWLGNGLLVSSGSYWQKRRKILTPAFHFKILEEYNSVFNIESNKLVKKLDEKVGDVFDINPYITAYTLDVICESAMGASVNAQDNFDNEYVMAVKSICELFIQRLFSAWKQFDSLFRFSHDYKKQSKALKVVHGFTKSIIEQRRQKLLNSCNNFVQDDDQIGAKKKIALLDILLQATIDGKPLSDEDIREEVDTFMFGGQDTIATLLIFAIYELARNPDIQDKVYTEVKEIYNNDKSYQPKLHDFNEMNYSELVIKEVMRLYPSVPYIGRHIEEDVLFKGTIFPKDLRIIIFPYSMHRRSDLFPNPETFNPERFLTKNTITNPFSYVPFSAGPRNCIGQKFAMYEAKATIAKILMHFKILPADAKYDVILSGEVVLKSVNGVHVRLQHR